MIKELIVQNWANVLVLLAFAVLLKTTVFLDNKTILRMYVLIIGMFVFSMVVFSEFYLADTGDAVDVRFVLMAIRYSTTPFIIAFIIYTLAKNVRWFIFIPAITLAALDIISIFTGIIFALDSNGTLQRGLLGYLPYITVGGYSAMLVYMLFKRSNKQYTEIFPIVFLCFAPRIVSGVQSYTLPVTPLLYKLFIK